MQVEFLMKDLMEGSGLKWQKVVSGLWLLR